MVPCGKGLSRAEKVVTETQSHLALVLTRCRSCHFPDHQPSTCKSHSILRYDAVTPGEGQRIAILRALCHNSQMVFLDEATSQIDIPTEQVIYSELKQRNVTYISVGHRDSIKLYHHVEINLNSDGSYTIESSPHD